MFFFSEYLGIHFNGLMVWGFLMAFFFSLLMYFTEARKDPSIIITSFLMFISYYLSSDWDLYIEDRNDIYIFWILADLATIFLIALAHLLLKLKTLSAVKYVYVGLVFNSFLFLGMHIDIMVNYNTTEWWFWSFYSVGMNVVDFTMVVSLIVAKDFLQVTKIKKLFTKKALN